MSFVIPSLTTVELTAAVPTDKFFIENYSKTSGIGLSTYYEALKTEDAEVLFIVFIQDNTDNAAKAMDLRVTVDDEEFTILNEAIPDNTPLYLCLGSPAAIDTNPDIVLTTNAYLAGLLFSDAGPTDQPSTLKGKEIKFEYSFDAIGANQEFHADIYYLKKEVA